MDNNTTNQVESQLENQNTNSNTTPVSNNEENEQRKSNTFNVIIGIATLLIAILGVTFAYFSATARSAENDVTVRSAYVSISYDGGTEIKASNLIPSSVSVAINKYQKTTPEFIPTEENPTPTDPDYDEYTNDLTRRCVDALGREVCYVYQFSVKSDTTSVENTDIVASITINKNEFDNLSYVLYEVELDTDETTGVAKTDKFGINLIKQNKGIVNNTYRTLESDINPDAVVEDHSDVKFEVFQKNLNTDEDATKPTACLAGLAEDYDSLEEEDKALTEKACKKISITNTEKHTYQLVIWLEETGQVQQEQGLEFQGTVAIEVAGGVTGGNEYVDGKITGKQ